MRLVWLTSSHLTFLLGLLNLLQGFIPAISVSITATEIDSVVYAIRIHSASPVWLPVGLQLGITLLSSILSTLSNIAQQLLQELVSNRVQLDILKKSSTLDLAFFENPEFYDKMRQAANQSTYQPVSMISQTFDLGRTIETPITLIFLLLRLAVVARRHCHSHARPGLLLQHALWLEGLPAYATPITGAPLDGLLRDVDDDRYL